MSVCSFIDKTFGKTVDYFQRLELFKAINVFNITDNSVWLDFRGDIELYCIKLETTSNREYEFEDFPYLIDELKYSDDGELFITFISKRLHKSIYVFSYSKKTLMQLSHSFSSPLLSGEQIITALYDIFLSTDHKITEDNRKISTEGLDNMLVPSSVEAINSGFKARIQTASSNLFKDATIFQGINFTGKESFSISGLFKINWEGVLTIRFDFRANTVVNTIKGYQSVARFADKDFSQICDGIINGTEKELQSDLYEQTCVANAFMYLKDSSLNYLPSISNMVGINFLENTLTGTSILAKTLFLSRDSDFDILIKTSVASKFFKTCIKIQVNKNTEAYFWGEDICGNFVNYSFKDSTSPHTIMIGRNGSGKSRQIIKMLEQIIGLNKKTMEVTRLGQVKVRYSDIGFTSGRLLQAVMSNNRDKVEAIRADVSTLRFSLFDLPIIDGKIPKEDMDYLIGIVNFAIQTKGEPIMTGVEEEFFKNISSRMMLGNEARDYSLEVLEKWGGYDSILQDLYLLGYTSSTLFTELPKEYDFFYKPTISDVIKSISIQQKVPIYSKFERESLELLGKKLRSIESYDFLAYHSNTKEKEDKDFFHIDFDSIKESPADFCVIYWLVMKGWIRMLKKSAKSRLKQGLEPIDTFFVIEEAHNFFAFPIFERMLITASKELRKYGGKLIFITQQLDDIPVKIAKEIGTKIFVAPPNEKAVLKRDIKKVFQVLDEKDEKVLDSITNFMMFIMFDGGTMGCKFIYEEGEDWFYKPYSPDF